MKGNDRKNCTRVAKNSPNKAKIPKVSTMNPKKECFVKMRMIPMRNAIVPRIFRGLVKKYRVFWVPMMRKIPMMKRMLAIAKNAASKKDTTPRKKRNAPAVVKKTPKRCV